MRKERIMISCEQTSGSQAKTARSTMRQQEKPKNLLYLSNHPSIPIIKDEIQWRLCSTEPVLHALHRMPMQADAKDDADVPDRVRAATEPVEPVCLPWAGEHALGEVRRVEDETGDVRE